eukprot:UN01359
MSHKHDSFSDDELTALATVIINDLSISVDPPEHGYMNEEYTFEPLPPFIESCNSLSTINNDNSHITYSQYNTATTSNISPQMSSNLSDSLQTLPIISNKLKRPYIKSFAGNKRNGIKQRLKRERNRKKHISKSSPTSPFHPPPTNPLSCPTFSSIDITSCITP